MKKLFMTHLVGTKETRAIFLSELLGTLFMVPPSPQPNYSAIRNLELELGFRKMEEIEAPFLNIEGASAVRYEPGHKMVVEYEDGSVTEIEAPVAAQIYRGSPPSLAVADAILKDMYANQH
jgi:hypothetical protein